MKYVCSNAFVKKFKEKTILRGFKKKKKDIIISKIRTYENITHFK